MKFFAVITLILIGIASDTIAQIVNIEKERLRNQDSARLAGKFAATAQLIENKGLSIFADFNPHIQFKKNRHIILLIGQWEYLSALSNTVNHGGYAHLRYNYRLKPLLKWEVFSQLQYNRIWNMPWRYLAGTGPRLKCIDQEAMQVYLGPLYLFEWQRSQLDEINRYMHRLSAYISWNMHWKALLRFAGTVYYQPRLNQWMDYRISGQTELQLNLSKHFSLEQKTTWIFDETGFIGIPRKNYRLSLGFAYRFQQLEKK